jgi:WD40 repeat protein
MSNVPPETGSHPLFDPDSFYGRVRAGVRPDLKMRGYLHWLSARTPYLRVPMAHAGFAERESEVLDTYRGFSLAAHAFAVLPDGRLAFAGDDTVVRLGNPVGGGIDRLDAKDGWVRALAVSSDGRIASGGQYGLVQVWDLKQGSCRTLSGHQAWVHALAFLPDGRLVFAIDHRPPQTGASV